VPAKADPVRDQVDDRLASATPPRVSNFLLKGVERFTRVNGINSPTRVSLVLPGLAAPMPATMRMPLSSSRGTEPPPKKAWFAFLGVSSRYVSLKWFLLLPSLYLNSKCDFWMIGVVPQVP
jgi:hypothetical protein